MSKNSNYNGKKEQSTTKKTDFREDGNNGTNYCNERWGDEIKNGKTSTHRQQHEPC